MLQFETPEFDAFWRAACDALGIDTASSHCAGTFAEPRSSDRVASIDALAELAFDYGRVLRPPQFGSGSLGLYVAGRFFPSERIWLARCSRERLGMDARLLE